MCERLTQLPGFQGGSLWPCVGLQSGRVRVQVLSEVTTCGAKEIQGWGQGLASWEDEVRVQGEKGPGFRGRADPAEGRLDPEPGVVEELQSYGLPSLCASSTTFRKI